MKTENGIEITYNEIGNIVIKVDFNVLNIKEEDFSYNLFLEYILDALGDADILTCNEINDDIKESDILIDSNRNVYFLNSENGSELHEFDETELVRQGTLKQFIDLENEVHIDFLKWYYGYNTAEEAINAMQTEIFN